MKTCHSLIIATILFFVTGDLVVAQKKPDFPQGPINYIVGFAPGGKTDIQARGIAPYVEKYLGVPLNIQNVPGAGGRIGYTKLFKAKPDGYTIGLLPLPAIVMGEYLVAAEYKTRELTPIFACFATPQVLVVAADTYKDLDEFVRAGKSKPLSNGTAGHGTSPHLSGIIIADGLGFKEVRHVHFESGGAAVAALAGKHIDFSIANTITAFPMVQAGKLKPLLVLDEKRDSAFPQVPVPKELGYKFSAIPPVDGVAGPPIFPLERLKALEEAFTKAASDPGFLDWANKAKTNIVPMDHEKFRQVIDEVIRGVDKYKDALLQK